MFLPSPNSLSKNQSIIVRFSCVSADLVARMIKFWNAPLLTTGGFTNDFSLDKRDPKSKYYLMVRTGTLDFQDIADVVVNVLHR